MSIFGVSEAVPENYLILLINSTLFSYYVDTFVNNTQTFQINDARQLPIIVPSSYQLEIANQLVADAINAKKSNNQSLLPILQQKIDDFVKDIYGIV